MNLETKIIDDILLITVASARLDNYVAGDFKSGITEYITAGHQRLIIDMSKVSFIDSSGLGALVSCLKLLGDSRDMVLCNISAPVLSLFKLTRMDQVFQIYPSAEAALAIMQG